MNIGVVLVTFNRLNDLKKALQKYEEQKKSPKYIVVVNNNSSDGTKEFLEGWKALESSFEKYVINLEENIGGSGGFHFGLSKALELDAQWIWIADDDAYADKNAFYYIEEFLNETSMDVKNIAALCGTVVNNGDIDLEHRRRIRLGKVNVIQENVPKEDYQKEYFELDLFSYVGSVINKDYLRKVGVTERDYFIYFDDTEHSYRISKQGKVLCLPKVRVVHDTALQNRDEINWKVYYNLRNRLLFYKKHLPYRYFYYEYLRLLLKSPMRSFKVESEYNKLIITAIRDAKKDIKGIHKLYKPGWKYKGNV